jgi:hypothetical protein
MNVHKNARLTPCGRERIVRQVESAQTVGTLSVMSASSAPFAALQPATSSVVGWHSEIDVEPVAVPPL